MGVTDDPNHPDLTRGVDTDPTRLRRVMAVFDYCREQWLVLKYFNPEAPPPRCVEVGVCSGATDPPDRLAPRVVRASEVTPG